MKTQIWIPKPGESARWHGRLVTILTIDMGGKCKIKVGRNRLIVDVSELKTTK